MRGPSSTGCYHAYATARNATTSAMATGILGLPPGGIEERGFRLREAAFLRVELLFPGEGPPSPAQSVLIGGGSSRRVQDSRWGVFAYPGLESGPMKLEIRCDGFLPVERELEIGAGETVDLEIPMVEGCTVAGIVVDDAGDPVDGVRVCANRLPVDGDDGHGEWCGSVETGESGKFELRDLPTGALRLSTDRGDSMGVDPVTISAPARGVGMVVPRWAALRVEPVGDGTDDDDVRGTLVVEHGGPWPHREEFWLDPKERWVLEAEHLAPGAARITISVRGYLDESRDIVLRPGETLDAGILPLRRGRSLCGRVVDTDGVPVPGVGVGILREGSGSGWGDAVESDGAGVFRLRGVAGTPTEIEVCDPLWWGPVVRWDPESPDDPLLVVERMATVTVDVRDRHGRPQSGVRVARRDDIGQDQPLGCTGEDGRFEGSLRFSDRARLPAGEYVLVLERNGTVSDPVNVTLKRGEERRLEFIFPGK